jgi:hypothetical protein
MYKELNLTLKDNLDFDRLRGPMVVQYAANPAISLSYFKLKDPAYLKSIFLKESPFGIGPDRVQISEMSGEGHLNPHTDDNVRVCANYYVEPNGATTYWYNKKPTSNPINAARKNSGIPSGKVYMFDDLECVDSFTAKQNDCYLLDVQQIHSVKNPNNGTRRFITFQWYDATFQDVLDSIHDSDLTFG